MNNEINMQFNEIESQENTKAVINDLLEDGSDPDALYLIEHHISSPEFDRLEKMAIEAFQLGYEMNDPEEFAEDISGELFFSFDIVSELPLDNQLIDDQIKQIVELCQKFDVNYDGWGTYFEDDNLEDEDEDEE